MKQTVRLNTFETNSSSLHTLVVVDKDTYDKFKYENYFFDVNNYTFRQMSEVPELDDFKTEYKDFDSKPDDVKKYLIEEYVKEYFNTDYAPGWTERHLDYEHATVYDKDGNEQVAMSIYISEA